MEPLLDSSTYTNLILFIFSVALCAIFAFLETSVTAIRLFKLKELAQNAKQYRFLFQSFETNPNRLLNTMLIANNLASVTAATTGTYLFDQLFITLPGSIGFSLSIFLTTALILVFGEIIPKNVAKAQGESLFVSTLWLTNICFYIFYPFVSLLVRLTNQILYIFSGQMPEEAPFDTSEKEIKFLIDYINRKGLMESDKTNMLQSIFEMGETPVRDIMVPHTIMISTSADKTLQEAYDLFNQHQFTRIPIYEGKTDNIIGMLHLKDVILLISKGENKPLKEVARPIIFVPESVKVSHLLKQLKDKHMHIAIVIDEYGGIAGLVTLEDVLEEIVGEIHDEYESVTQKIIALKPGGWLVDAHIPLSDLEDFFKLDLPRNNATTLSGFLTEQMQHLPQKGDRFEYENLIFQVHQATPKRVTQVLVFDKNKKIEFS